jgi:hypothetical protein
MTVTRRVAAVYGSLTRRRQLQGQPWPALGAAVVVTRARLALDRVALAELLGVPPRTVRELEEGACPPSLAPRRLADLAPDIDWQGLGVPVGRRPPRCEPASRHPAAHRPGRTTG